MDLSLLKSGLPDLVMQGLLMDVQEGTSNAKGKEPQSVLNVQLLQTQQTMKNGVEMSQISSRILVVKDREAFGEYYALLGSFISVPVGNMGTSDGGSIFWIPKGAHPKLVSIESQPPASRSGVKSPLDKAA